MELFFDTETSDKFNFKDPNYKHKDFPWCVQLAAVLAEEGIAYAEINLLVKPDSRTISDGAARVHQITTEEAKKYGVPEYDVANVFYSLCKNADSLVAHNYQFDSVIMAGVLYRNGMGTHAQDLINGYRRYCTMLETTDLCKLPGPYGNKWPKLQELHTFLFNEPFIGAHDAMFDIKATMKCYYELKKRGHIK